MRSWREEWAMLHGRPETPIPTIGDEPFNEVSDKVRLNAHPLVSVIVTIWNHEKWLDECIDSMVRQKTDFSYEILLCEDWSTDASREICKKWQTEYPDKIRILYGEKNLGVWKNVSLGYREAKGKYVALLEGDDYWTDTSKLQKQIDLMVSGGYRFVVAWNDVLNDKTKQKASLTFPAISEIKFDAYNGGYYHTSTYLFEKSLREELHHVLCKVPAYDTVFFISALERIGRIGVLPEKVSMYRRTGEGIYTGSTGIMNAEISILMFSRLLRYGSGGLRKYCKYSYECALLNYFIHTCRERGFSLKLFLVATLVVRYMTFRVNPKAMIFLWCSAAKSLFLGFRKQEAK